MAQATPDTQLSSSAPASRITGSRELPFAHWREDRIQAERERQTDRNPAAHTPQSRGKNDPQYMAALRAQGHANAEFVGPLRHGVGDHAEEPDRRQRQRQAAEDAENPRRQMLLLPLRQVGDPGFQILGGAVALLFRVHLGQLHPHRAQQGERRRPGPHQDLRSHPHVQRVRHEDRRLDGVGQPIVAGIPHNAHDLQPRVRDVSAPTESPADATRSRGNFNECPMAPPFGK